MEQKSRALVRKGVTGMFARPGWREFFLDLATNPHTRQLVHVARLQVGADAVAANFGVVFGGCYYHVLASYCEDSRAAHFAPGALHLRELLKYAIERGQQRFDFTIGDERYKLEWCDSSVKLYDHATAATWRSWPAARCGRAAPAQTPDQADALGVERGLRRAHCARRILAPDAAVNRAATGRRREHPPDARPWSGFDIRYPPNR
jgi:CelD/BcsL family acetyltransferase involved in cellulose biosynthesis